MAVGGPVDDDQLGTGDDRVGRLAVEGVARHPRRLLAGHRAVAADEEVAVLLEIRMKGNTVDDAVDREERLGLVDVVAVGNA